MFNQNVKKKEITKESYNIFHILCKKIEFKS